MSRFVSTEIDFEFLGKNESKAGFDPNQPRNADGTWGSGGGVGAEEKYNELPQSAKDYIDEIRKERLENLGIFCDDSLIDRNVGTERSVGPTDRYKNDKSLALCLGTSFTIHNHPNGTLLASLGDMETFIKTMDDKMIITTRNQTLILEKIGDYETRSFTNVDGFLADYKAYYNSVTRKTFTLISEAVKKGISTSKAMDYVAKQIQKMVLEFPGFKNAIKYYYYKHGKK